MGLHSTVYMMIDGDIRGYGPGDDVPEDVARQIGAHAFEDGVHPFPDSGSSPADGSPPAQAGQGSSTDAWAKYAEDNGVTVDEGASRKDIIEACREAGVAVDKQ